jgi:hypothetical protein
MKRYKLLHLLALVALVACVPTLRPVTSPAAASPTLAATATASPVPPSPTTPAPTNTAAPSNTPQPTSTPKPTDTPLPTDTSTPVPEPVNVSGHGDQIVDAVNPYNVAIVHVTGNKGSRYFGVTNYDADNNEIGLLVNTTDPYNGYRPLDVRKGPHTARFQVKAVGDWTIEILPLSAAHSLDIPGAYSGTGDDVIVMYGHVEPDTAHITGNQGARYFGATSYGSDGAIHGLVNTTDVYDGSVLLSPKAVVLEFRAFGDWTIDVKTK